MHRGRPLTRILVLVGSAAIALSSCSSAPRSGNGPRQTILLDTTDDARVGKQASTAVAAQIGLYEDAVLEAYVDQIGQKLLRGVPRHGFQYQFKVIDQFEPNAFALPGGYIYVSRGLLALANSEDEIACVIGHEITHAARRHAARQQELAIRGPLAMPWIRAGNQAAYGRDMEREADRGGQFLAAAAGYDPMGMSTFLAALGQIERLKIGHARRRSFLDTHPGAGERAAVNATRAQEIRWTRNPALGDTQRRYLERIDGLPVAERPQAGMFEGDRFLHPDLDFQIHFPPGWRTTNSTQAVGALSPGRDAMVFLMADQPPGDPKQIAEAFVVKTNREAVVEVTAAGPVKIGAIDAYRIELEGSGGGGGLLAVVTFIPYGGATWRITGVSPSLAARQYRGRFLNTARSFRPLRREEREAIVETRLQLVAAAEGDDVTALGRRSGNHWDPGTTAVYNGIFTNHRFRGGERVKIARVQPYRSAGN